MSSKHFIIFFFIGSLIIFLFLPLFNYTNDQWRVLKKDYFQHYVMIKEPYLEIEQNKSYLKMQYLIENKDKYDTLMMGSSRLINFNSNKVSNTTYNMTYSFGLLKTHLDNLKILIKNNMRIKHIYLGINDYIIYKDPDDFNNDYLRKPYKEGFFNQLDFYLFYLLKKPKIRDIEIFLNNYNLKRTNDIIDPSDFSINIKNEIKIKQNPISHIEYIQNLSPTILDFKGSFRTEEAIKEIEEFKELCKKNKIELTLFIFPPYYKTYFTFNQEEINKFKIALAKISPFYDFYKLHDFSFDEMKWHDTSHFTPEIGDILLTSILNKENITKSDNIINNLKDVNLLNNKIFSLVENKIFNIDYNIEFPNSNVLFDIKKDKITKIKNMEIEKNNEYLNIVAKNNDPQLYIKLNKGLIKNRNVILSTKISSENDTNFVIYYKNKENIYTQANSYSYKLKKGDNEIKFLIPYQMIRDEIRVDVSTHKGKYEIKEFNFFTSHN